MKTSLAIMLVAFVLIIGTLEATARKLPVEEGQQQKLLKSDANVGRTLEEDSSSGEAGSDDENQPEKNLSSRDQSEKDSGSVTVSHHCYTSTNRPGPKVDTEHCGN
ncbi:hypothetical protein LguiA_000972 [Lonicera macranthoides]